MVIAAITKYKRKYLILAFPGFVFFLILTFCFRLFINFELPELYLTNVFTYFRYMNTTCIFSMFSGYVYAKVYVFIRLDV